MILDYELVKELNNLRSIILFRSVVIVLVVCCIAWLISRFTSFPLFMSLFFGIFVVLLLYVFFVSLYVDKYIPLFKDTVVKNCVSDYSSDLKYVNEHQINSVEFGFSNLYTRIMRSFGAEHTIESILSGTNVTSSLVNVKGKGKPGASETGGGTLMHHYVIFRGLYIFAGRRGTDVPVEDVVARCIVIPKVYGEKTPVTLSVDSDSSESSTRYERPDEILTMVNEYKDGPYPFYPATWSYKVRWGDEKKVLTGNTKFDDQYIVYAEKPEYVKQFLTVEIQEKIFETTNEWNKNVSYAFALDRCHICIPQKILMLRPEYVRSVSQKTITRIGNELERIHGAMKTAADMYAMVCKK